tara:strand:- start:961 stop:1215 length:255 start_codon:yes stop_codon:yes gene_type:complete
MTVSDLIEELQNYDDDTPVVFASDYGDYCHTEQALTLDSIEEVTYNDFDESAYSNSGVAVQFDANRTEDDEDDDIGEDPVLIIR